MSLRDFDSGLQSAFELLWKSFFFLVCLKIAQLSFKWADICSWEEAHLLRFNSGELATLSLDESWMKWQKKKKRVYNSLHKRLKCLSVSILFYIIVLYLHIIPAGYCWGLWGENLTRATSVFPHGGVSLRVVSHPYWVTLYILIAVLCTVCLFKVVLIV